MLPALKERGVTDEQIHTMLVDNPRKIIFETQGPMPDPVPPLGSQVSQLAQRAPDQPAITCEGRTITRAELDASTNRLARVYQERGVGIGDYVTIALPNSIEFLQAVMRPGRWARSRSRCRRECPRRSSRGCWRCIPGHW